MFVKSSWGHSVARRVRKVMLIAISAVAGFWTADALLGNQEPKPQPAAEAAADQVAATVNGDPILETEVQAGLRTISGGAEGAAAAPNGADAPAQAPPPLLRGQVIEMIISSRLIEQFIAKQQIAVEEKEIDEFIARVRNSVEDDDDSFAEYLEVQGQTEASLRRRIAGLLGWQKYVKSRATEGVLQEYFEKNKPHFDGTQVCVSQILLKVPADASQEQLQALVEKLRGIRSQIAEKSVSFAEAAQQHSQSPSGKRGGDLGFIPRRRRMYEPFAQAAFDLKLGEVSEPVLTPQGLHLIAVTEIKPGVRKFADAREELQNTYSQQLEAQIAAQQRKGAKIEVAGQAVAAPPSES